MSLARTSGSFTTSRLRRPRPLGGGDHPGREGDGALDLPPDPHAVLPHQGGVLAEPLERLGVVGVVVLGQHPVRGALEQVELADLLGDLGHELHRAGGAADHADPLAGEAVVVVPAGGVERGALERVEAVDLGVRQVAEHADGADDDVGDELVAGVGEDPPHQALLVPEHAADRGARSGGAGSRPYFSAQCCR